MRHCCASHLLGPHLAQTHPLGEEQADHAVGVFVAAKLPGLVRLEPFLPAATIGKRNDWIGAELVNLLFEGTENPSDKTVRRMIEPELVIPQSHIAP